MLNYSANGPSGYNLTNSLRFRSSASAFLSRTFATTGTNNKIQTFSAWVKRGLLSSSANYRLMGCYNGSANWSTEINFSNDSFRIEFGGSVQYELKTTQVFRDPSAWYHIVIAIDTTQATASNRIKMYINGTQVTAFSTANYPAQNDSSQLASANANNKIGANWNTPGAAEYFDGYMAEINFIDGQALTPSSFGSTNAITGVWQPARYTGTYGTNGFYLNFTDIALTSGSNTGLGRDFSGNGNFWNTNNISVTSGVTYDAMSDVPTLTSATVANYCVLNPLNKDTSITVTNANLSASAGGTNIGVTGSIAISSGKWYWEVTQTAGGVATSNIVGITDATLSAKTAGLTTNSYGYGTGTTAYKWNAGTNTAYGVNWTNGDVIGVAFDADAGSLTFYKNGSSQGTAFTGISGTFYPAFGFQNTSAYDINFGQRPFAYTPPTGFVALNTYNLPTPTILQGNKYMDATLYTGNGSTQTITNAAGFRPDFVWVKGRNAAGYWNALEDSVRGAGKFLSSNSTNAETGNSGDLITSFNSNGFSVNMTLNGASNGTVNDSTVTYVGWQWQAGQGTNTTNTAGSITSTVSANTTAGFSIVTYTGTGSAATVGHGLGVAPKMIIVKNRTTGAGNGIWRVYHASLGGTQVINLNETTAAASLSTVWNNTNPTSNVFSVGITGSVNDSSNNYVAYCWAEIAGFSAFGSYTGNGSTDGPFVYTGFRPKYVMIKVTSITNVWLIIDSVRNTYNVANLNLNANDSSAENTASTGAWLDFTSNGFKIRNGTDGAINTSSNNYIYACFAENPFKNALAR